MVCLSREVGLSLAAKVFKMSRKEFENVIRNQGRKVKPVECLSLAGEMSVMIQQSGLDIDPAVTHGASKSLSPRKRRREPSLSPSFESDLTNMDIQDNNIVDQMPSGVGQADPDVQMIQENPLSELNDGYILPQSLPSSPNGSGVTEIYKQDIGDYTGLPRETVEDPREVTQWGDRKNRSKRHSKTIDLPPSLRLVKPDPDNLLEADANSIHHQAEFDDIVYAASPIKSGRHVFEQLEDGVYRIDRQITTDSRKLNYYI